MGNQTNLPSLQYRLLKEHLFSVPLQGKVGAGVWFGGFSKKIKYTVVWLLPLTKETWVCVNIEPGS